MPAPVARRKEFEFMNQIALEGVKQEREEEWMKMISFVVGGVGAVMVLGGAVGLHLAVRRLSK